MEIEMIPVAIDGDIDADAQGLPDLGHAMSTGRTKEMEQCVAAILQTPAAVMSAEQKFSQLWLSGGLYGAFKHGQADTAASFTRLIAAAPSSVLDPQLQLKLLSWPVSTQRVLDMPLLHSIAAATPLQLNSDLRIQQHRAIFGYVHEIAASDNLSLTFKTVLCAAALRNPATTAAQAAVADGNAGAAAAMMCGILSASADVHLRHVLVQSLGVSVRSVLSALTDTAHGQAQWAPLLLALLNAARGTQEGWGQLI